MNTVLINTTNLHSGGGVQVATSFVDELSRLNAQEYSGLTLSLFTSSTVMANLEALKTDLSCFQSIKVIDIYGLQGLKNEYKQLFNAFDLIYTVFGPDYVRTPSHKKVTGFAQPWIIYPDNEIYKRLSPIDKLKTTLKFKLQTLFFKSSAILVTELDHVKQGLIKKNIKTDNEIHVVYNCVSALYFSPEKWLDIPIEKSVAEISIGYITRDYPHKNVDFLLDIHDQIKKTSTANIVFYVTLTEEEWQQKSARFKSTIKNIGSLLVNQCPRFYQQMDAIIFPSFLECFSATPIETFLMKKPLFASNRGFVKDVCEDNAYYFEPTNAVDAATTILDNLDKLSSPNITGYNRALAFANPQQRALSYLAIIKNTLSKKHKI